MQKSVLRSLMMLVVLMSGTLFAAAQATEPVKGVVRVKLQPEVARSLGRKSVRVQNGQPVTRYTQLDQALQTAKAISIRPMFPCAPDRAAEHAKFGLDRWYEISFDESVDPIEVRQLMRGVAGIEIADVKKPMKLIDGDATYQMFEPGRLAAKAAATADAAPFNDPRLSQQWHYHNTGSMVGSVAGADINLFEAWKVTTGSPDVVVAIIDGGVDPTHEDLAQNLWVNTAEIPGNGIDDDGNGYVDDVHGFNFCARSGEIYGHNHGTHVAGTVAAVNNNGRGVCGVAGGDGTADTGVRLMSCQVYESRVGVPGTGDFAEALVYAADNGAHIAQCSWGWDEPEYKEDAVLDAVRYFTNAIRTKGAQKMVGGLCIFAAGNSGITGNIYPACMDEVLSVGAMTLSLQPASYSNYGPWVDVMAPGGLLDYSQAEGILSTLPGNSYGFMQGTSMACPHVSGIAALVLSKYGSPDFPSATLKTQLETSVGDFYAVNPGQEGKYGTGYIDANKAVHMVTEGEAPDAVADFDLMPAQESISVQWVIPASSDNAVFYHQVFYSTQPFTEETLSTAQQLVADTKFSASGDTFTFEIPSLQPLTTYYVAIKAVNRLGKASPLSPVKSAATNAGPDMTVEYEDVQLNVAPQSPVATAAFKIVNDAEGLLKWKYTARTVSANISMFSLNRARVMPFGGQAGVQPRKAQQYVVDTEDYLADDFPKSIAYYNYYAANIGETRKTKPNAMAQLFTVNADTYPEGFNLTHYKVNGSANGQHPIVSIYRGPQMLTDASRIIEFDPFESGEFYFGYGVDLSLSEQLYFAPGESFWIVMRFPAEDTLFPLPIAEATSNSAAATSSYMSNDDGRTWTRLSEVLRATSYADMADAATWGITAISKNPDWATVLSLDPSEGIVEPHGSQQVSVRNDGQPLCNGTYSFNIGFTTNESEANTVKVPVTMNVSGYEPEVKVREIVDFGSLIIGQSKTLSVSLTNTGYGSTGMMWNGSDITCSNPAFEASGANGYVNLAARSKSDVEITFTPTQAGPQSGTVVLKPSSGKEIRISVQGVATEPAKIVVDPQEIEVGDIDVDGDPITKTFTIKNEGKYPLQYVLPKFSEETLEVGAGGKNKGTHRFGYGWLSNLGGSNGFAYDGGSIPAGAVDVTSQLNDQTWFTQAIPVGFEFPFYGKNYTEVYVCSYGALTFAPYDVDDSLFGNLTVMNENGYMLNGLGVISAFGRNMQITANTRILYSQQPDRFSVYFCNISVSDTWGEGTFPISFHISLLTDGSIEIHYDKYDAKRNMQEGRNLYCGVLDPGCSDGMTVTSSNMANYWYTSEPTIEGERYSLFGDGTAVCITAPQANMVTALTPADGIVSPGETVTVTVTIAGNSEMIAGPIKNNLLINSTAPNTPSTVVTLNGNVVGASLKPVLSVPEAIDFGTVYRTSVAEKTLAVTNSGKRELTVSAVSLAGGKFVLGFTEPVVVPAGQSRGISISLPTSVEGEYSDVATVTTDAGSVTVAVSGKVIGCPGIDLGYDKLNLTIPSGSSAAKPLSITNSGDEPMTVSLIPGDYIIYDPDLDAASKTTYGYKAAFDTDLVQCDWIDITSEPGVVHKDILYYVDHDISTFELPFEFSYYGKKYKKLYIYNTGFISFNEYTDNAMAPEPPADFPAGSIITNVIAPFWGNHFPGEEPGAGTYAIAYPDRAIISWMEYGNSMNAGVCYQLILNADGTFKFQYHGSGEEAVIFNVFGKAGISNDGASEGFYLPERLISFDNAVLFTPVTEYVLNPGASMRADITVSAAGLMAGAYATAVTVNSNVPGKEAFDIPVEITVTGQADPVFPESVSLEKVKGFVDNNDPVAMQYNPQFWGAEGPGIAYSAYVDIVNKGTASFQIKDIQPAYKNLYDDEYYGEPAPIVPTVMIKTKVIDDFTGEYVDGWMPFAGTDIGGEAITVASEPVTVALPISGEGMGLSLYKKTGVYEDDILIFTDLREEPYVVSFRLTVTESPELTVDKDLIEHNNVASDFETVDYFTISNTGKYRLDYNLKVNLSGDDGGGIMPTSFAHAPVASAEKLASMSLLKSSTIQPFALEFGKSDNFLNTPLSMDYIHALYYPVSPISSNYYSLGAVSNEDYWVSTAYTAPASGINISHIYAGGIFGPQHVDKNIQIYIFLGQQIDDSLEPTSIAHGTYAIEVGYDVPAVQTFVAELDEPVQIAPGQVFTVMLVYPDGAKVPFVQKQDAIETGRYMAFSEKIGMWMDAASYFESQVGGPFGWVMSCIETVIGEDWVSIDPQYLSGSLQPGESAKIPVQIKAYATAKEKDNAADIQIFSNDPVFDDSYPDAIVTVSLNKNGKPIIDVPSSTVAVNVGETAETSVTVSDPDGDKFIMHFMDNGGDIASIKEMIPDNEDAVVEVDRTTGDITVTGASNIEVYLQLAPKDGDAGSYAVTVYAMDLNEEGKGIHSPVNATVKYRVEQVNRAPVFNDDVQPIFLTVGETTGVISLADMFTDPDGDEITCTHSLDDEGIVSIFASGNNVIITGDKVGTTRLNVTATDPAGLSTTKAIDVTVAEQSGINDIIIDAQLGIWPNPVVDVLNVSLGFDADDVEYSIFSISGTRVFAETADARASQTKSISVSQLPAGTYLLRVACADGRHASRVIVKQ